MGRLKENKSKILILLIGGLSIINIILSFKTRYFPADLISIVGMVATALFFLKKSTCRYFIWIWIVAQIIIIDHVFVDPSTNITINKTIFDLSQTLRIKIGFYITGNHSAESINFNLLVVLYFFLFKNLKIDSLIGKTFNLLIMKYDHDISCEEGIQITLTKRVNLEGDDNWLLGSLNKPIIYNQQHIEKVLIYTENEKFMNIFRIVPNKIGIELGDIDLLSNFERVDWMMIA